MATASKRGVALVTGAAKGIGYAIASALAAQGFDVALASMEDPGPELDIFAAFGRARYYPFDLADLDRHDALLERIEQDLGTLACLVNNAGVSSLVRGDLLELTPREFRSQRRDQSARHVLPDPGSISMSAAVCSCTGFDMCWASDLAWIDNRA